MIMWKWEIIKRIVVFRRKEKVRMLEIFNTELREEEEENKGMNKDEKDGKEREEARRRRKRRRRTNEHKGGDGGWDEWGEKLVVEQNKLMRMGHKRAKHVWIRVSKKYEEGIYQQIWQTKLNEGNINKINNIKKKKHFIGQASWNEINERVLQNINKYNKNGRDRGI